MTAGVATKRRWRPTTRSMRMRTNLHNQRSGPKTAGSTELLTLGNNLEKAQELFAEAMKGIRPGEILKQWPPLAWSDFSSCLPRVR